MRPSKVVILGHTGFIGAALTAALRRRGPVPVVGFSSADLDLTRRDGLATLAEVAGPDAVWIMAAATHRRDDALETYERNAAMLANVADFLAERPAGRCVYFSSASVYGDAETNLSIDEDTAVAPTSRYGAAKAEGEAFLRRAAESTGMSLVILRPCRVYGPGDGRAAYGPTRFIQSVLEKGSVEIYGDGRELRDHVFIGDVARLTRRFVFGDLCGVYNVASGSSHSYREMLDVLRGVIPIPFEVSSVPRTRPRIDQRFNVARLRRDVPDLRFTPLDRGLRETYLALVSQRKKGRAFA